MKRLLIAIFSIITAILIFQNKIRAVGVVPPRVDLSIDKLGIEGRLEQNRLFVSVPVQNHNSESITASSKFQVVNLDGKPFGLVDKVFGIKANKVQIIRVEIPLQQKINNDPGFFNLKYQLISQNSISNGVRSLLPVIHPFSIRVLGGDHLSPGQLAGLRVLATRTGSGIAVSDLSIRGHLDSGNKSYQLFQGKTAQNGSLPVRFQVPQLKSGQYRLIVEAENASNKQEVATAIQIEPNYRIYITSDKPIYQPSQTIHFRALALSAIQNSPAAFSDFVWEIQDPKGNRLYKKSLKIDRFGIAAGDFDLAEEVNLGTYKIKGTVRGDGFEQFGQKDVTVSRYVLPKFKVEIKTERNYYLAGERVTGEIHANYFFGKPLEGTAKLTAAKFDIGFSDFWNTSVVLRNGKGAFDFILPEQFAGTPLEQGNAFVQIKAQVEDAAAQEQEETKKITITSDSILVAAIPASLKIIKGVENRVLVVTQYPDGSPAKTEVQLADKTIQTSDSGIAVVKFRPNGVSEYLVSVRDAKGRSASRKIQFDLTGQGLILTPSKGFYRVGETLNLQVFSNISKTVYIDFIKNNQTLKTETLETDTQQAVASTDLSADFVGSVLINAYSMSRDGEIYRDSKWVVVEPVTELKIDVHPDRTSYMPGDKGRLRFHVSDQQNRAVSAALGVAIVDEAVFSVSELRPGLEKIYFLLEEELQKPRFEIHALSFEPLVMKPVRNIDQAKAEAALANTQRDFEYRVKLDSYENSARSFVSKFQSQANAQMVNKISTVLQAVQKYYQRYQRYPQTANAIRNLIDKGLLKREQILDPWRESMVLKSAQQEIYPYNFTLVSKGPDEALGTADDIEISPAVFEREERLVGMAAEAPAMPAAVAEKSADVRALGYVADKIQGGAAAEPLVREYFPETLLFKPAVITDANGNATLDVPLADSITDWRVSITASSASGNLGSTTSSVRVFQDFFVDLDLPVALTKGDEVSVPVAVYNYLKGPQVIKLELQQAPWFISAEQASQTITIQPNEIASAHFRIRAEGLGKQKLIVKAYGNQLSDAVQREVLVEPNGQKVESTVNGRLGPDVSASIAFPSMMLAGTRQLLLKIYPGIFNQLLEGLDSILQMPYGCFEQTSSTTYPNVLALQYMKASNKITPEIQMKAEAFINNGYQRLVTFEVPGGGFSWFGQAPANKILTAYGLMEFKEMSSIYDIDSNLIARTANWLVSQQQADGSWKPDEGGIAEGAINRYQKDVVRIASYIGWGLTKAGGQRRAIDRAAEYVHKNYPSLNDPYGLAVAANFLIERDPRDPVAHSVLQKLFAEKIEEADVIYWKQEEPTAVYSEGPSAYVEATALATLAFLRDPEYSAATSKMLTYLIKQKDPRGTWYSTQATIWALKAFVGSLSGGRETADAVVEVIINGKLQKQVNLNESNADVMQVINLTAPAENGSNQLQLKMHGKAHALFALVARYTIPWSDQPAREALQIRVSYDKTNLDVNDTATARVTIHSNLGRDAKMVMVDLGIPPGFRISTNDLDGLVENSVIEKYSLTGRQAILYFEKIPAGRIVQFNYHVTAKFPIRASSTAARVYEYYNPQRENIAAPVQVIVR